LTIDATDNTGRRCKRGPISAALNTSTLSSAPSSLPLQPGMFYPRIPTRALCARSYATVPIQPPLLALNSVVREKAEKLSRDWRGTSASGENTKNFIGGEFVQSKATQWIDVVDPVRRPICSAFYFDLRSRHNSPHKHSSLESQKQPTKSSTRQWPPPLTRSKRGARQQY
jgi:hypothetical protein